MTTSTTAPTLDDLKAAVDAVEVISRYTVLEQHGGTTLRGVCPLHNGSNPTSFVVYPEKKTWHCFGDCAAGGDLIKFVQLVEGTDFRGALEVLAAAAGMPVPAPPVGFRPRPGSEQVLVDAAAFWKGQLGDGDGADARAYLERRGISLAVARAAGVGFCPLPAFRTWEYLVDVKGHTMSDIVASKVYDAKRHTLLGGRVVVPIATKGRITNVYGRAIVPCDKGDRHRYIAAHHGLYGLDEVAVGVPVVMVEGILDALALRSAGITHTAATFGTGGLSEEFAAVLAEAGASEVVVFYDGDVAGKKASVIAARRLRAVGVTDRITLTPPGEDPASLVVAGVDVAGLVASAGSESALTAAKLVRDLASSSATERILLADALDRLARIDGLAPFTSEVVLSEIASIFGVEPARARELFAPSSTAGSPDETEE